MVHTLSLGFTTPLLVMGESFTATSPKLAHRMACMEIIQLLEHVNGTPFPHPYRDKKGNPLALQGEAAKVFGEWWESYLSKPELSATRWNSPQDDDHARSLGSRIQKSLQLELDLYANQEERNEFARESRRSKPPQEKPMPTGVLPSLSSLVDKSALKSFANKIIHDKIPLTPKEQQDYELAKFAMQFARHNPKEVTSPTAAPATPIVVAASPARGAPAGKPPRDAGGRSS